MYLQNIESNLIVLKLDEKFLKKVRLTAKPKSGVYPGRWKKNQLIGRVREYLNERRRAVSGFPVHFFVSRWSGGRWSERKAEQKGTWKREIDSSGSAAQEFLLQCPVDKN